MGGVDVGGSGPGMKGKRTVSCWLFLPVERFVDLWWVWIGCLHSVVGCDDGVVGVDQSALAGGYCD